MKKVILSVFALMLLVAFSSCRETKEESNEDQNVDSVKEEPAIMETSETIQVEVVVDSTNTEEN
ncbi:hypothetical protein [Ulvibacter sp. MAR_2010_11]|uniref:hypothetical protein n=1 Tax=Ulvibacter sp. MAR_2010_11 TaxID=1250229 RepID=UPI000C2CC94D|nr:hypothetical protein [Ulvibacter sp. MAR_2010_11]